MRHRFATFNVALSLPGPGQLIRRLSNTEYRQARYLAEIIQRVKPDVLVLNEFDYDAEGTALRLFQQNYLRQSQHEQTPIHYPYAVVFPTNSGVLSGVDLNGDGLIELPYDGFGYGLFAGQYAFALLSRYPLLESQSRTFQHFLWQHMPEAKLPEHFYSDQARSIVRLSSKNHVDIPVTLPGAEIHLLLMHPAPPVFDSPARENARRNFDEIRLFTDYVSPAKADYLYDDQGKTGGLKAGQNFIIMGDLNADPNDGGSWPGAIKQLLEHPEINQEVTLGQRVPQSRGGREYALSKGGRRYGHPALITAMFNNGLRVDYVLPSKQLTVSASGVFWPPRRSQQYYLVADDQASSDHRLVWIDIEI